MVHQVIPNPNKKKYKVYLFLALLFLCLTGNWQISSNGIWLSFGQLKFSLYVDQIYYSFGINIEKEMYGHNFALFYDRMDKTCGVQLLYGNKVKQCRVGESKWLTGTIGE